MLRQTITIDGQQKTGEQVFKQEYTEKHKELLTELRDKKVNAVSTSEHRLYDMLFTIVRKEFDTVHEFIK